VKEPVRLSAIALFAATLAASPAGALTLNLGGSGSGTTGGDAAITLDTGNLLGSGDGSEGSSDAVIDLNLDGSGNGNTGGVLDLGSSGTLIDLGADNDDKAVIDLGLGTTGTTDGLLDLGGGDGTLLDLGDGPLLDLSGGEDGTLIAIGDGLDLGTTGGIGGSGTTRLLDLSSGGTDLTADLNLEGEEEPVAKVNLLNSQQGAGGTGALGGSNGLLTLGGKNAATLSLTDADDDSGASGSSPAAKIATANDEAGSGDDGSGTGTSTAGAGTGTGSAFVGTRSATTSNQTRVATATTARATTSTDASACLDLEGNQLNQLVDRHTYDWSTFSSWADAESLRVIEVNLCGDAVARVDLAVDSSANVARLQAFLAGQAKVLAGLQQTGHTPDDVIAADGAGDELVVYVTNG